MIMKRFLVFFITAIVLVSFWFTFKSCTGRSIIEFISGKNSVENTGTNGQEQKEVAYDQTSDQSIQEFNIAERKKRAVKRFAGDTLELMEYVFKTYPKGSYLIDFDRTSTYNIPQSAVIYSKQTDGSYILGIVAKSKPDDPRRTIIEQKNVIGYDQSYIDYDSTRLGTAIFFLTLFKYSGSDFSVVWEDTIPRHGGFNKLTLETWAPKGTPFIKVNFHDAQWLGHDDYNYFLINGLTAMPHLLETYDCINRKRTMVDYDHDKYPDYCEYIFYDTGNRVGYTDSVFFAWSAKDSVYINVRNKKQTRRY